MFAITAESPMIKKVNSIWFLCKKLDCEKSKSQKKPAKKTDYNLNFKYGFNLTGEGTGILNTPTKYKDLSISGSKLPLAMTIEKEPNQEDFLFNKRMKRAIQQSRRSSQMIEKYEQIYRQKREAGNTLKTIAGSLIKLLEKIHWMNLDPRTMLIHNLFPKTPFQSPLANDFIREVKRGEIKAAREYFAQDPYIGLHYDLCGQMGIHWAAKRGDTDMVRLIVKNICDIDAMDSKGRTPMYFAVCNNSLQIVKILLLQRAHPFCAIPGMNYNYLALTENEAIKKYIKVARKCYIALSFIGGGDAGERYKNLNLNLMTTFGELLV